MMWTPPRKRGKLDGLTYRCSSTGLPETAVMVMESTENGSDMAGYIENEAWPAIEQPKTESDDDDENDNEVDEAEFAPPGGA